MTATEVFIVLVFVLCVVNAYQVARLRRLFKRHVVLTFRDWLLHASPEERKAALKTLEEDT